MDSQSQPPASLALAEQILARHFGGVLRLALQLEPEGGSQRSTLLRCRVLDGPSAAPPSVILKRVNLDPGQIFRVDLLDQTVRAFLNECASLTFLTRLTDEGHQPIAPRLYGTDSTAGLLVMEDLGQDQSLVQPLLGDDRAVADPMRISLSLSMRCFTEPALPLDTLGNRGVEGSHVTRH